MFLLFRCEVYDYIFSQLQMVLVIKIKNEIANDQSLQFGWNANEFLAFLCWISWSRTVWVYLHHNIVFHTEFVSVGFIGLHSPAGDENNYFTVIPGWCSSCWKFVIWHALLSWIQPCKIILVSCSFPSLNSQQIHKMILFLNQIASKFCHDFFLPVLVMFLIWFSFESIFTKN